MIRNVNPTFFASEILTLFASISQEGKDMLVNDGHHLPGFKVLETRPTEIVVIPTFVVGTLREDAALHWDPQSLGLALF